MAEKRYQVKAIFGPTIQGEGPHSGRPCVFLRLSGCNAWDGRPETRAASACPYCDTDFRGGELISAATILERLRLRGGAGAQWGLVISGGEPLLQLDEALLQRLTPHFPWIDIESNGTCPAPPRAASVCVICSPKALANAPIVLQPDAWKILIPAQESFLPQALASGLPVYVQPLCPDQGPSGPHYQQALRRCLDLVYEHGCTLSLQTHKYIGVE